MAKFPAPYVNDTGPSREKDPMMERVPIETMDIGARRSGLPKDVRNGNSIEHVGNTTGGPVKDRA
jgi:hypothetical protein